ncbi:DUF3618 domain-containing protein [Falsiroseomonas selenitidurans]|uniref:DUF3618 domain-containing protein n=1 Tax=Falsiroseomonas selenitidurans TaxID=2716335 RepID=A0ABX1E1M8_9PROT|nr:DUF3618 domain-containing protein [Falsiroseomonas selenitidurans]NKC31054.1 DUF3618 domain-containing protein [Falsiroseomonas selenitidurans]
MSGTTDRGTTDPGGRSSAEIEHEVEETRAGLTDTLEQLRDRASPGQLFEQALDYARGSGGVEFTRNLGAQVRDNPLPLLLIGAGIGWLMLGGQPRTRQAMAYGDDWDDGHGGDRSSRRPGGLRERAGAHAQATGSAAGHVAQSARQGLGDAAHRAGDAAHRGAAAAGSAYRSAAAAAGSAGEAVSDRARDWGEGARQAGAHASAYAADMAEASRHRLEDWSEQAGDGLDWVRDQPLVLGGIGLALGAALGAMLPRTDTEDRLMGETRDDLTDRARAAATEGYAKARESLGERGDSAAGAAEDALPRAREAVRDAAHQVAGEAKRAMGEASDPATTQPGGNPVPPRPDAPQPPQGAATPRPGAPPV